MTPDVAKLKGTIWPGMTLFDAATEEMQKKRNQKKDGSILKHMQASSAMIEPLETTYSPGGTLRRERHMDDLEDDDDLLEGETLIKRSPSKRRQKRKGLKKLPVSVAHRKVRRAKARRRSTRPTNSSTSTSPGDSSSSSSQDGARGGLPLLDRDTSGRQLPRAKKHSSRHPMKTESTAFTHGLQHNPLSHLPSIPPNLSFDSSRGIGPLRVSDISMDPASWLLSQPVYDQDYDSFKAYRSMQSTPMQAFEIGDGKESFNPLFYKQELAPDHNVNPMCTVDGTFDDITNGLGELSEVYAYTRNPFLNSH